jgi:hypothetical protein
MTGPTRTDDEALFKECALDIPILGTRSHTATEPGWLTYTVLESGHRLLYSTNIEENPIGPALNQLSERSEAIFTLCVAVQCFLSGGMELLYQRYDSALAKFRIELQSSGERFKDSTIAAGLLLCTLGVCSHDPPATRNPPLQFGTLTFVRVIRCCKACPGRCTLTLSMSCL